MLGLRPPGFEGCVCRAVSSDSSHHLQEIIMALFSLYAHTYDLQPCPVTPDLVCDNRLCTSLDSLPFENLSSDSTCAIDRLGNELKRPDLITAQHIN